MAGAVRIGEYGELGVLYFSLVVLGSHAWLIERMAAVAEEVHDDGAGPHIYRLRVGVVAQDFRRHVEHRPALAGGRLGVMEVQLSAEAKISDFESTEAVFVGQEDVVCVGRGVPGLISRWMMLTEWI
jgi:hypothetical protein